MDFCPECNNYLRPAKIGDEKVLQCRCGYVAPFNKEKSDKSYTITKTLEHEGEQTFVQPKAVVVEKEEVDLLYNED
jgi:DNA-directed RNA polymerase subunit M/transcription elongation factor TFIIS